MAHPVLTSPEVQYYGVPVAFVVAETFEEARAAAYLVRVDYERSPGRFALRSGLDQARAPARSALRLIAPWVISPALSPRLPCSST